MIRGKKSTKKNYPIIRKQRCLRTKRTHFDRESFHKIHCKQWNGKRFTFQDFCNARIGFNCLCCNKHIRLFSSNLFFYLPSIKIMDSNIFTLKHLFRHFKCNNKIIRYSGWHLLANLNQSDLKCMERIVWQAKIILMMTEK